MRFSTCRMASLFLIVLFATAICPEQVWFVVPATAVAQDNPFNETDAVIDDSLGASAKTVTPNSSSPNADSNAQEYSKSESVRSPGLSTTTLADDAIRQKLSKYCDFDFDEASFINVKAYLEKQLGVNIVLTSSASDDALTKDESFTSQLSGITFANALRIILANKNATYVVTDGAIQLISLDESNDSWWCARRMFIVSEALELIRVAERDRIGKAKPGSPMAERRLNLRGGGGVFAIQTTETDLKDSPVEAQQIKKLADAITQAVLHSQPQVQLVPTLVTAESILIDAIKKDAAVGGWCDTEWSITCVGGVLITNLPETVGNQVESFVEDLTFNMKKAAATQR